MRPLTIRTQQTVVGRLADQSMAEAVGLILCPLFTDKQA